MLQFMQKKKQTPKPGDHDQSDLSIHHITEIIQDGHWKVNIFISNSGPRLLHPLQMNWLLLSAFKLCISRIFLDKKRNLYVV